MIKNTYTPGQPHLHLSIYTNEVDPSQHYEKATGNQTVAYTGHTFAGDSSQQYKNFTFYDPIEYMQSNGKKVFG